MTELTFQTSLITVFIRLKARFTRILDSLSSMLWQCSCVRIYLRQKWTDLDEIWSTLSTLSGAGPGRFWARSLQDVYYCVLYAW